MNDPDDLRMTGQRIICWFSCGAASAVATKLVCAEQGTLPVEIVYTKVEEEHDDNQRFLMDCQEWFGQEIKQISNEKYGGSIYTVFLRERYIVGPFGAPCTRKLKREVREKYQREHDIHVMGFTAEERDRSETFQENNPTLQCCFPLIERNLSKADCLAMILDTGIRMPTMYLLGYDHNNCIGCVKGGMGYWNKIRKDFPDVFARMATLEREIGAAIIRTRTGNVFLDELDPSAGRGLVEPSIECGIFCEMAKQEYAP